MKLTRAPHWLYIVFLFLLHLPTAATAADAAEFRHGKEHFKVPHRATELSKLKSFSYYESFYSDIASGRLDSVRRRLQLDPALINSTGEWGWQPLHYATIFGGGDNRSAAVVEHLIAAGADLEATGGNPWNDRLDSGYSTPLHLACLKGSLPFVRLLLSHGANIEAKDEFDNAPIQIATVNNWTVPPVQASEAAFLTLTYGPAFIDPSASPGADALGVVQELITRGAALNGTNSSNFTLLHTAAFNSDERITSLFLAKGLNANARTSAEGTEGDQSEPSYTPLLFAAMRGNVRAGEVLLANGADPNLGRTPGGESVLHQAVNSTRLVARLLARGADMNATAAPPSLYTPLHSAAMGGHTAAAKLLIKAGASTAARAYHTVNDVMFDTGSVVYAATPLFYAAQYGQLEMAKLLLSSGGVPCPVQGQSAAGVGESATDFMLPLKAAVTEDRVAIVSALLSHCPTLNLTAVDSEDTVHAHTALIEAVSLGRTRIVELLLRDGRANPQDAMTTTRTAKYSEKWVRRSSNYGRADASAPSIGEEEGPNLAERLDTGVAPESELAANVLPNAEDNEAGGSEAAQAAGPLIKILTEALLARHDLSFNRSRLLHARREFDHRWLYERFGVLHCAAENGNAAIAALLLRYGAEVDAQTAVMQSTPLYLAAYNNQTRVVEVLLAHNATVDARSRAKTAVAAGNNSRSDTPLMAAAHNGHHTVVQALLKHGADVNARGYKELTALHLASYFNRVSTVKLLLARDDIEVNAKANFHDDPPDLPPHATPLHIASIYGHMEIAEQLLLKGADVNARSMVPQQLTGGIMMGWKLPTQYGLATPALYAAMGGHYDLLRLLHRHGASLNESLASPSGCVRATPLLYAVIANDTQMAEFLFENGAADVDERILAKDCASWPEPGNSTADASSRQQGFTALHISAQSGLMEMTALLIANGADVNARDGEKLTPLHAASMAGAGGMAELLLDNGADLEARGERNTEATSAYSNIPSPGVLKCTENGSSLNGSTPIHYAAVEGHLGALLLLLQRGAHANTMDSDGYRPLQLAIINERYTAIALLQNGTGVDVDAQLGEPASLCHTTNQGATTAYVGYTALHFAVARGSAGAVDLLLAYGARTDLRDSKGYTPLDIALELEASAQSDGIIAALLMETDYPVHNAVSLGKLTIVQRILDHRSDRARTQDLVTGRRNTSDEMTPLELAIELRERDVVGELLLSDLGIRADEANPQDGKTPLQRAVEARDMALVKLLVDSGIAWQIDNVQATSRDMSPLQLAVTLNYTEIADFLRAQLTNSSNSAHPPQAGGAVSRGRNETERMRPSELRRLLAQLPTVTFGASRSNDQAYLHLVGNLSAKHTPPDTLVAAGRAQDATNNTFLHLAAMYDRRDLLAKLLSAKFKPRLDVNAAGNSGFTPLHFAVDAGHRSAVDYLLSAGANPNAKNDNSTELAQFKVIFAGEGKGSILASSARYGVAMWLQTFPPPLPMPEQRTTQSASQLPPTIVPRGAAKQIPGME